MFPLDVLCVMRAWTMDLRVEMPGVRTPMIRLQARETKGLPQRFQLQKDRILPTPEAIGPDRTRGVIHRMPQPPLVFLLANNTPHFIHRGFTSSLQVHAHLGGIQGAEQCRVDRLQRRFVLPERTEHRVGPDPEPPRRIAKPTGVEAQSNDLLLDLGQTPTVARVEQKTPLSTRDILAQVALWPAACFATVDDLLAEAGGTWARDERHGPLLAVRRCQDEVQCDIKLSSSPLLAHYPGRLWIWQYVFPSDRLSEDPRTGIMRRHHANESGLQKAVSQAVRSVRLN